jgi:hypothetical protein
VIAAAGEGGRGPIRACFKSRSASLLTPFPPPLPPRRARQALARVSAARGARPPPDPRNALNVHGHHPAAVAAQHGAGVRLLQVLLPGVPVGRVVDVRELLR